MVVSHPAKLTRLLMCGVCSLSLLEAALASGKLVQDIAPLTLLPVASASSVKPFPAAINRFARPVFLRGKLGEMQIQMHLHPHVDYEDSVQGDYFVFGKSTKVLLAGELQADELVLEESANGRDVSGQWIGTLEGVVFSGIWYSGDQSRSQPFELTIVELQGGLLPPPRATPAPANLLNKVHRD